MFANIRFMFVDLLSDIPMEQVSSNIHSYGLFFHNLLQIYQSIYLRFAFFFLEISTIFNAFSTTQQQWK